MTAEPEIFVAEDDGPPRRRFWIARDKTGGSPGTIQGWSFVYDKWRDGEWQVGWDTWERWFFEILRYPAEHSSHPLTWRREDTGEVVDLSAQQERHDGVVARPDQTPGEVGLPE